VSSSIGSNIFDVLIGLPVPWLAFSAWQSYNGKEPVVGVAAPTLFCSLIILFIMVGTVIGIIVANNWCLTKNLGYSMFVLYVLFVFQDVGRTYSWIPEFC